MIIQLMNISQYNTTLKKTVAFQQKWFIIFGFACLYSHKGTN